MRGVAAWARAVAGLGTCGCRPKHGSGPPRGALEVVVVGLIEAEVVGELSPHDRLLEVRLDALAVPGVVLLDEERGTG